MHISEGVLSIPVLASGGALAIVGTYIGLKKMDYDQLPKAGILAASFFVASLIYVPVGVVSIHLVLNGLCGIMLGWGSFPIILVALILQAVFFQFGGLTTLGVNTIIMALPAVIVYYLSRSFVSHHTGRKIVVPFLTGFCAVLLSAILMAGSLFLTGEAFFEIAGVVIVANFPVMFIEGVITFFCVSFLKKVYPALLFDLRPK